MDWFLYDNGLRHERVQGISDSYPTLTQPFPALIRHTNLPYVINGFKQISKG